MARLIKLDRSGHTTIAEWTRGDEAAQEEAVEAFRRELDVGMLASVSREDGTAELPLDEELVVLRRPIAGG